MQNTFSQSGNDSKWFSKKSFFKIGKWHSRPPRDPPPFMANAILNFHFDYLTPSLSFAIANTISRFLFVRSDLPLTNHRSEKLLFWFDYPLIFSFHKSKRFCLVCTFQIQIIKIFFNQKLSYIVRDALSFREPFKNVLADFVR